MNFLLTSVINQLYRSENTSIMIVGVTHDLLDNLLIFSVDPTQILRPPYKSGNIPDASTRTRIAGYFAAVLSKTRKSIQHRLPEVMPRWGKVRIVDGDEIRSISACGNEPEAESLRDMAFVRVRIIFIFVHVLITQLIYISSMNYRFKQMTANGYPRYSTAA